MPFKSYQRPEDGPPREPRGNEQRDELFRIAGLKPSRSGNALVATIDLNRRRDPEGPSVGEGIIQFLQKIMEENKLLGILIFESKFKDAKFPYMLNFSHRERIENYTPKHNLDEDTPPWVSAPEASPSRRTAPRR